MLLNNLLKFVKTIRFQLTLLYSMILFLLSTLIVLSLNVYMDSYLTTDPVFRRLPIGSSMQQQIPAQEWDFKRLQFEERMRIQSIRLNDLRQIQELSMKMLFPIVAMSFALGYVLSGKFLSPIGKLGAEIDQLKAHDLGKTIPISTDDEVGSLIASFNDLSVRLKRSFVAQERFVQDASHEIKTPLTVIQTNIDTALDDKNASSQALREAMKGALKGVKNLKSLTNYLLELTVGGQLNKETTDITELVREQIDVLSQYAQDHNVTIASELPKETYLVNIDKNAIGRAVFNLIENAIKYSEGAENAIVTVNVAVVKEKIVISVHDVGIGIPEKDKDKIFDRFYRIDKSRSRKNGGFGLGLAIAKKSVEEHGGSITVVSKSGDTTFTLSLSP